MDKTLEQIKKECALRLRTPTPTEQFAKAAHNHLATLFVSGSITEEEFNMRAIQVRAAVAGIPHKETSPKVDISFSIHFTPRL